MSHDPHSLPERARVGRVRGVDRDAGNVSECMQGRMAVNPRAPSQSAKESGSEALDYTTCNKMHIFNLPTILPENTLVPRSFSLRPPDSGDIPARHMRREEDHVWKTCVRHASGTEGAGMCMHLCTPLNRVCLTFSPRWALHHQFLMQLHDLHSGVCMALKTCS